MCIYLIVILSGSVTQAPRVDGQHITITYSNGDACKGQVGKNYRTEITFICKTGLMVCKLELLLLVFFLVNEVVAWPSGQGAGLEIW